MREELQELSQKVETINGKQVDIKSAVDRWLEEEKQEKEEQKK